MTLWGCHSVRKVNTYMMLWGIWIFIWAQKVCHDISTPQMGATLFFFYFLFFFTVQLRVWLYGHLYAVMNGLYGHLYAVMNVREQCHNHSGWLEFWTMFVIHVFHCNLLLSMSLSSTVFILSFLAKSFSSSSLYPFMHKFTCLSNPNVVTNVHLIQ